MTLQIEPWRQPDWTPLDQKGCFNVSYKSLLAAEHVHLAMLQFQSEATIHEHPAPFDVDVFCLEGSGFTSVGEETAPLKAGEKVRWPAGKNHRLWTTENSMVTLMVEHRLTHQKG